MKLENIKSARMVAREFVRRSDDFLKSIEVNTDLPKIIRTKESGALNRASMELTRQLARMRQEK